MNRTYRCVWRVWSALHNPWNHSPVASFMFG